ncbi:MAG: glycosyltransferase [Mycoplasmataceae bacterium]|nr:glycosyltransferase [Mycoplasmataceae bacterium]
MIVTWITGVYNLVYILISNSLRRYYTRKLLKLTKHIKIDKNLKVILLVTVKDDFLPNNLLFTLKQTYKFSEIYILDDSITIEFKKMIDDFGKKHNCNVVRRNTNELYKVGNLNNWLKINNKPYDYIVNIDADELLPPNFVEDNLKIFYVAGNENIGMVQSTQSSYKQDTFFANAIRYSLDSGSCNTIVDNKIGIDRWFGHGSIISKKCLEKMNFKYTDIMNDMYGVNYEILSAGYKIFISNLAPTGNFIQTDSITFRRAQIRNLYLFVEYAESKFIKILFSKKISFQYKCLLSFVICTKMFTYFSIFCNLIINAILFGLNYHQNTIYIFTIISILFSITQLLNYVLTLLFRIGLWKFIIFIAIYSLTWSAIFYQNIEAVFMKVILRKNPWFRVTPKYSRRITLWQNLFHNRRELISMTIMMSIAISLYFTVITDKSSIQGFLSFLHIPNFITPFLTIVITQVCGVAITATTNIRMKNDVIELKIDLVHNYKKMKNQMNLS